MKRKEETTSLSRRKQHFQLGSEITGSALHLGRRTEIFDRLPITDDEIVCDSLFFFTLLFNRIRFPFEKCDRFPGNDPIELYLSIFRTRVSKKNEKRKKTDEKGRSNIKDYTIEIGKGKCETTTHAHKAYGNK